MRKGGTYKTIFTLCEKGEQLKILRQDTVRISVSKIRKITHNYYKEMFTSTRMKKSLFDPVSLFIEKK